MTLTPGGHRETKERPGEAVTPQSGCFRRGSEETGENKRKPMGTATHGVDVPTDTTRTSDELSRAGWNARSALQHAIKEQVLVQEETCSVQKYSAVYSRTKF